MVKGNEVTCCSTEVSLSCFSIALHKSSSVFSVGSQLSLTCHCQERKGTTKEPGSATAFSTTAGVQDRMIIELVTPITPAQLEECQKHFFWEHLIFQPSLRFEGTEHKVMLCNVSLPLPASRGSCCCCGHCSVPQGRLDLFSSPCWEVPLLPKGSGLCSVLL